jgi:hypothetical protein
MEEGYWRKIIRISQFTKNKKGLENKDDIMTFNVQTLHAQRKY